METPQVQRSNILTAQWDHAAYRPMPCQRTNCQATCQPPAPHAEDRHLPANLAPS